MILRNTILLLLITVAKLSFAQSGVVLGTITDGAEPVPFANVVLKGTTLGASTNESGEFRVLAKQHDSLQISFVGYKSTIIIVKLNGYKRSQNVQKKSQRPVENW